MNGNLGRDKLWNPQIWSDIDKAVQEEVGRVRVAQKVFPCAMVPSGQLIPANKLSTKIGILTIPEGESRPLVEISVQFTLTQSQVDSEESQRTGRTLARIAANKVAATEDVLLFQGKNDAEKFLKDLIGADPVVKTDNAEYLGKGLLGEGSSAAKRARDRGVAYPDFTVKDVKTDPDDIVTKVGSAIAELRRNSHVGPYALFLSSEKFADASAPITVAGKLADKVIVGTLFATPAERINPLLAGGFHGTGSLLTSDGLLVSLGGEPTMIYIGTDTTTEFTQIDRAGRYRFRVFERFQFVARDSDAFVRFDLK